MLFPLKLRHVRRQQSAPASANVRRRPQTDVVQMREDGEQHFGRQSVHKTRLVDGLVLDVSVIRQYLQSVRQVVLPRRRRRRRRVNRVVVHPVVPMILRGVLGTFVGTPTVVASQRKRFWQNVPHIVIHRILMRVTSLRVLITAVVGAILMTATSTSTHHTLQIEIHIPRSRRRVPHERDYAFVQRIATGIALKPVIVALRRYVLILRARSALRYVRVIVTRGQVLLSVRNVRIETLRRILLLLTGSSFVIVEEIGRLVVARIFVVCFLFRSDKKIYVNNK